MPLHEEGKPDPEGLQLWIDLPAKDKMIDPQYQEMLGKEWVLLASGHGEIADGSMLQYYDSPSYR